MSGPVSFGSKAETLDRLGSVIKSAKVLPQYCFTQKQWVANRTQVIDGLRAHPWADGMLIVRSSALDEDGAKGSRAGAYESVLGVRVDGGFEKAVEQVAASFGDDAEHQVLVQPQLTAVSASGVAFSRDPSTGAPCYVVNYETGSGTTTAVTSGASGDLRTYIHARHAPVPDDPLIGPVVRLLAELRDILGSDAVDLEFGLDEAGELYLFQVRPLVLSHGPDVDDERYRRLLDLVADRIALGMRPSPFLCGKRTVYGVMPDWNPAEIIGVRPNPLALSLYRDLVTDAIWAYQRNNYGYRNLRSFPLVVHFQGQPYVDVRVSFNSFVPADIPDDLADRLVNYYIDRLAEQPHLHDKVEFDIIFSCYTPGTPKAIEVLRDYGFDQKDTETLLASLKRLTNNIIDPERGLWRTDLAKLDVLEARYQTLSASNVGIVERIYWLLEDCKRYGSLPFAGLARAGFIAVQMVRSLRELGIFSKYDYESFMGNLSTVSSELARDRATLERTAFLARYGHLRPGTYDVTSPRYDEAPDLYFDWQDEDPQTSALRLPFALSVEQMKQVKGELAAAGIEDDVVGFLEFLKAGIEGREHAKFMFTRNLSDAISLLRELGESLGFPAEDMAFADVGIVRELYASSSDPRALISSSIEHGRKRYKDTRCLLLPPLITRPDDIRSFWMPPTSPNFITQNAVTGPVTTVLEHDELEGAIVMIPNADPGFDWLFSFPIAGLITAYGGVNSHMAIRAGELGIPAVIGAGNAMYEHWSKARVLALDCANRMVTVVR